MAEPHLYVLHLDPSLAHARHYVGIVLDGDALLRAAQTEAVLADAIPLSPEARTAAYEQQLSTAGAAEDPTKRIALLLW